MAKPYPQSRNLTARIEAITNALSYAQGVLLTFRDVLGPQYGMPPGVTTTINDALAKVELASRALTGDDPS